MPDASEMTTVHYDRTQYVRCNTFGHAWFDYDSNWDSGYGTPLTLRCERCGTERRDVIDDYGDVSSRQYIYPDGYRYVRGESRPSRSDFRISLLQERIREARSARKRA